MLAWLEIGFGMSLAQQGLGQFQGEGSLANAWRAGEQEAARQSSACDGPAELLDDFVLSEDSVPGGVRECCVHGGFRCCGLFSCDAFFFRERQCGKQLVFPRLSQFLYLLLNMNCVILRFFLVLKNGTCCFLGSYGIFHFELLPRFSRFAMAVGNLIGGAT
jgi:hypothetical protein